MKKKHLQPLTPAALYARVSSDRQDVDLSVSAQLRALKDYAGANGYSVAREYVDEAESGLVADRPQFREMIEEGSKPKAPFDVILVWKFSRFTRKREHAVAFKSMLRRKGIRVVSITEQAEDNATGRLLEGIIESVDEFYSENLAQEVVRGMREAASRGFFLASNAPFGYKRVKVNDGGKERPTLEVDPAAAPVVREIFEKSLRGNGLCEGRRDNVPPGRSSAEVWRLKTVPPVAFNQERPNLIEGGLDVQGGDVPASSQGLLCRRDEHSRGCACIRTAPGHGAQDAQVLGTSRVSTRPTASSTEAGPIQGSDRPDPGAGSDLTEEAASHRQAYL